MEVEILGQGRVRGKAKQSSLISLVLLSRLLDMHCLSAIHVPPYPPMPPRRVDLILRPGCPLSSQVIFTNVGNPHALGQKPLTFIRQVFALVRYAAHTLPSLPLPEHPSPQILRA